MVARSGISAQADRLYSGVCRITGESGLAMPGELVLFDSSKTTRVDIARATAGDVGKAVVLKNVSADTSNVRIIVTGGGVIDGQQSITMAGSYASLFLLCVHADAWSLTSNYGYGGSSGSPSAPAWSYFDRSPPPGVNQSDLKALWKFDGTADSLKDRTGFGHDLTLSDGTTFHVKPSSVGLVGLGFHDLERYVAGSPSALQIIGDLTIEVLHHQHETTGNDDTLIECAGSTDSEADNFCYTLRVIQATSNYYYLSEHGAGTNDVKNFAASMATPGIAEHIVLSRTAAGALALYQNGELVDSGSVTPPTGGTSAIVTVGCATFGGVGGYAMHGVLYSIRIWSAAFTAAQALASYQRLRAPSGS